LRALVAPLGRNGRFFASVPISGTHVDGIAALTNGQADVTAIDCVTYALLERYRGSGNGVYWMPIHIDVPRHPLAEFCRRHQIQTLSLFGSVLREDFRPDSDIDVLVEFEDGHVPGLSGIARMERELSEILGGRKGRSKDARRFEPLF
jgi:predicted nucleotidyltransferase